MALALALRIVALAYEELSLSVSDSIKDVFCNQLNPVRFPSARHNFLWLCKYWTIDYFTHTFINIHSKNLAKSLKGLQDFLNVLPARNFISIFVSHLRTGLRTLPNDTLYSSELSSLSIMNFISLSVSLFVYRIRQMSESSG